MPSGLEDRVRRLEDIQAITEVLYRYAHYIDRGQFDDLIDLFVPDANFRVRKRSLQGGFEPDMVNFTGRDNIRPFAEGVYKHISVPPRSGQVNIISQPAITLDGDDATAMTYSTIVKGDTEGREVTSYGRYQDEFVRCGDGRWRIKVRVSEVESVNPR